jgi:two-component system nitrogen regulation response regulator NtrX
VAEKRILIVEDMPDWQEQLQSVLRRDGYTVTTMPTYGEALGELRRTEYQLVIVDLRLNPIDENNRDGVKLLKDLKMLQIPSIVVTGYGTTELAREASDEYQVFDFMGKDTLDLKKLRRQIREAFLMIEGREKELRELRYRFMKGEVVNFPESAIDWSLRERKQDREE